MVWVGSGPTHSLHSRSPRRPGSSAAVVEVVVVGLPMLRPNRHSYWPRRSERPCCWRPMRCRPVAWAPVAAGLHCDERSCPFGQGVELRRRLGFGCSRSPQQLALAGWERGAGAVASKCERDWIPRWAAWRVVAWGGDHCAGRGRSWSVPAHCPRPRHLGQDWPRLGARSSRRRRPQWQPGTTTSSHRSCQGGRFPSASGRLPGCS